MNIKKIIIKKEQRKKPEINKSDNNNCSSKIDAIHQQLEYTSKWPHGN